MIKGWAVYRCNSPGWPAGSALFTALSLTETKQQQICRSKLITKTTQVLLVFMVSLFTVVHLKSELSTNFVLLWVVDTPMSVWALLQARLWVSFTLERSSLAAAYRLKIKKKTLPRNWKTCCHFKGENRSGGVTAQTGFQSFTEVCSRDEDGQLRVHGSTNRNTKTRIVRPAAPSRCDRDLVQLTS